MDSLIQIMHDGLKGRTWLAQALPFIKWSSISSPSLACRLLQVAQALLQAGQSCPINATTCLFKKMQMLGV